jgi:hypothetical protein
LVFKGIFLPVFFAVSFLFTPSFAGSDYTLEQDRFDGKKTASYKLSINNECKLVKTLKSKLAACHFLSVSNNASMPSILLVTTSNGWDIMSYKNVSPYSDNQAYAIVTYKNGAKENTRLNAVFDGSVLIGGKVMETIILRVGSIKKDLPNIENIELKYGTNEYSVRLDQTLTRKALNYQQ